MAGTITHPERLLRGKQSVPGELRTAQWAMVLQWVRERSFYMAGVGRAEILQEFREEARKITAGESGMAASEKRLQAFLDQVRYAAEPGQEGTIKDLRSWRRMQVALRTNVQLVQGWSQKERGLRAQIAVPAWELVRLESKRKVRDWLDRWQRAGGTLHEGRMIALKTDIIWLALGSMLKDSLGVDYPPFAWGSGMGWLGVRYAECKRLGILTGWTPPPREPVSSPNENLTTTPRVSEPALRKALADDLKGLAKWDGNKLVFTDPNGTRKTTAQELGEIWKQRLPDAFSDLRGEGHMQREAFLDWVIDSGRYWNDPEEGEHKLGSTDRWEDFLRVLKRLLPNGREKGGLFRGLGWHSKEQFSNFMHKLRRDGYAARDEVPAESWAASIQAARKYAAKTAYQVILKLPSGHRDGRDIAPLVQAFRDELLKREVPQGKLAITDDEIILPAWAGLRVKRIGKIVETKTGKTVEIELEEVPQ